MGGGPRVHTGNARELLRKNNIAIEQEEKSNRRWAQKRGNEVGWDRGKVVWKGQKLTRKKGKKNWDEEGPRQRLSEREGALEGTEVSGGQWGG